MYIYRERKSLDIHIYRGFRYIYIYIYRVKKARSPVIVRDWKLRITI
jgi:hypothetical protein